MNADQTTNATSDVRAQDDSTTTTQTYVLNDADRRVLAIASGRHGQWFEKGSDGQSFSDIFGGRWLERISARTTAWALLAAAEYTLKKFENGEKFHEPVLVALARSGYIEMALAVIRADEQLVFLDRSQRTFVKKDDFDHCVNVGNTEAHTALKDCSLWTLCKHLHAQVCAGVNLCFERNLRDLPIRPDAPAKVTKAKGNGNGGQANGRAPREKPTSRSAEDATWNGLATADFSVAIDEISAAYNRMLAGSPDFSDAYKALGHARHVHFSQLSAQRKAEFEKKREERQTNRAQNPKEVRPKKDVRSKKNGEVAPKATPSEQGTETQTAAPARAPAPPTASAPAVNVWAVRKTETQARTKAEEEAEAEAQDTEQTEPVEGESKSAEKTAQKGANSRVRVRREKPATNTDADGFTIVRSKAKAKAHATNQPRGKGKYQGRKPVSAPLSSDTA